MSFDDDHVLSLKSNTLILYKIDISEMELIYKDKTTIESRSIFKDGLTYIN